MAFADNFIFARPNVAPWYDQLGVLQEAAVNVPRIGWYQGVPIGLIVEAGGALGQNDSAVLAAGVMTTAGVGAGVQATVLHGWRREGGALSYDGHYTIDAEAMINECLAAVGWHASIQVVVGYLHNWGGWVWAFGNRWQLPGELAAGSEVIADSLGRPLISP